MEIVSIQSTPSGRPTAIVQGGRAWCVAAEPIRWFERTSWWEGRRMPSGTGRVDIEVLQVQVRLGLNPRSGLTTMELVRDGPGSGWRLRAAVADTAA
ncbi:hypothetical protein J7E82_10165 [Arthrobacter sp. ISL-30]|nr:hypothetical protein [Arthrobacter sp. ISL-30]